MSLLIFDREQHQAGSKLIHQGLRFGRERDLEQAILYIVQGLELIDQEANPRLTLAALHNLAIFLTYLGHLRLARAVIVRGRRLYRSVGGSLMRARLAWLQATIARERGRRDLAFSRLERACEIFEQLRLPEAEEVREEMDSMMGWGEPHYS